MRRPVADTIKVYATSTSLRKTLCHFSISDVAFQSEPFPHAVDLRHRLLYQRCSFDTSRSDVLHMLSRRESVKG